MKGEARVRAYFAGELGRVDEEAMRAEVLASASLRALYNELAALERLVEAGTGGRPGALGEERRLGMILARRAYARSWPARMTRRVGALLADGLSAWRGLAEGEALIRRPALAGAKDAGASHADLGDLAEGTTLRLDFQVPALARYAVVHVDDDGEVVLHPDSPAADVPLPAGHVLRLSGVAEGVADEPKLFVILRLPDGAPPIASAPALLEYALTTPEVAVAVHPYRVRATGDADA